MYSNGHDAILHPTHDFINDVEIHFLGIHLLTLISTSHLILLRFVLSLHAVPTSFVAASTFELEQRHTSATNGMVNRFELWWNRRERPYSVTYTYGGVGIVMPAE